MVALRALSGAIEGAATQAMRAIVEERQRPSVPETAHNPQGDKGLRDHA